MTYHPQICLNENLTWANWRGRCLKHLPPNWYLPSKRLKCSPLPPEHEVKTLMLASSLHGLLRRRLSCFDCGHEYHIYSCHTIFVRISYLSTTIVLLIFITTHVMFGFYVTGKLFFTFIRIFDLSLFGRWVGGIWSADANVAQ